MCIVCKYLLTAGLREQNINVTQLWPGILKFSPHYESDNLSVSQKSLSTLSLLLLASSQIFI